MHKFCNFPQSQCLIKFALHGFRIVSSIIGGTGTGTTHSSDLPSTHPPFTDTDMECKCSWALCNSTQVGAQHMIMMKIHQAGPWTYPNQNRHIFTRRGDHANRINKQFNRFMVLSTLFFFAVALSMFTVRDIHSACDGIRRQMVKTLSSGSFMPSPRRCPRQQ